MTTIKNINRTNQITILLVEPNSRLRTDILSYLETYFHVQTASSISQAQKLIQQNKKIYVIISNLNLHQREHSLMDGLSIVRFAQTSAQFIPVIIYSYILHPLAVLESQKCGVFKLLDLSKPEFKLQLLSTIKIAIKIVDAKKDRKRLTKKRKELLEKLQKIDLVKPIQFNCIEENLYNCFFQADTNHPYRYANNWAYICQSARDYGHYFFNGSCLITITLGRNFNSNDLNYQILNPLGKGSVKKTLEIARELKEKSGTPVLIKKVTETQTKHFLKSNHCTVYPEKPKSKKLINQYDDIHPQVVVNIKAFMNQLTSTKLYNYQRNLKKFHHHDFKTRAMKPELFNDFLQIIQRWKKSFIKRYNEHNEFTHIPTTNDYYLKPYFSIFDYYSRHINNKTTISSLVYVNDIPVGFSFLGKVSTICLGMYANISDTNYDGIAEFMLYNNFNQAYWYGYRYVNLGGTESKYLYNFYKRFNLNFDNEKSFEQSTQYLIYN